MWLNCGYGGGTCKFGRKLTACLAQQANITLLPESSGCIERSQQHCGLSLKNGEKLSCSLLVAADGIQSQIAKQCGVKRKSKGLCNQRGMCGLSQISQKSSL